MSAGISTVANGNISPCTFVICDNSTSDRVIQATGTSTAIFGISYEQADQYNFNTAGTLYCAVAGEPLGVYGDGCRAYLTAGSGGWLAGSLLTSDSNGNGIIGSTGNQIGAIGTAVVASGQVGEVIVRLVKA